MLMREGWILAAGDAIFFFFCNFILNTEEGLCV